MKLRDGQPLVVGKTYRHKEPVVMCDQGYHASERLIDALRCASGSQVSRVEVWGDIQRENDKIVGRNRKVLWTLDATRILHLYACDVIEQALAKSDNPDPRSLAAIEAKRRWLAGKADEELSAADAEDYAAAYMAACAEADEAADAEFNTLLTTMVEAAHAKEAQE